MKEVKVVTKSDWERVLKTMKFYKRNSGHVDFVDNKLTFFDSDPQINETSACFVTKENVIQYIDNYE